MTNLSGVADELYHKHRGSLRMTTTDQAVKWFKDDKIN